MTTQPEALRLADALEKHSGIYQAATELRRLHRHELVLQDWLDKTNWVQETAQAGELGMHRADALKKRIEKLEASNQELLAALKETHACILGDHWGNALDVLAYAINKAERTTT